MQRALLIAAAVLLFDQATKWAILGAATPPLQPQHLARVTGFFNLVLTYNTGVSFGMFQGEAAWQRYFLIAVNLGVSLALLIWLRKQVVGLMPYAIGLVVGGAIGNAIDRLHQPGVVDFLDFHLAGWHWPAFNVADSAIVCGVALLIADGLFQPGRKGHKGAGIGR
jgi:signal peptidase II